MSSGHLRWPCGHHQGADPVFPRYQAELWWPGLPLGVVCTMQEGRGKNRKNTVFGKVRVVFITTVISTGLLETEGGKLLDVKHT